MKKLYKNIIAFTTIIILIIVPTAAMAQQAEVANDDIVDEPIAQIDCFGAEENFGSFLQSFLSVDDFGAFFTDIQMNACQWTAAKNLKDDLKDLRSDIKEAYYSCDNNKANNLRIEYNRKEAELFFVRNMISTKGKEKVKVAPDVLKNKLYDTFVSKKKYFLETPKEDNTKEVFEEVFIKFTKTYDPNAYIECPNGIDMISDKIEGLRDTIQGITEEFKQDKKELNEEIEKNKVSNQGNKSDSTTPIKLNAMSIFAFTINQVIPQRFAEDIIRDSQNNSLSVYELTARQKIEKRRHDMDMQNAVKLATYKAKYQYTSDAITTDYNSRIQSVVGVINDSNINLTGVDSCLQFVNETQCSE